MNAAVHVVLAVPEQYPIKPVLEQLHWLPLEQ